MPLRIQQVSPGEQQQRLSLTGAQSTVLYRADLVRARRPFFTPGRQFPDSEAAMELLLEHDLGFVHEVLSFTRTGNDGTWTTQRDRHPLLLLALQRVELYGPKVLAAQELAAARARARRDYFGALGRQLLRRPDPDFWRWHRQGLAVIGWRLRRRDVLAGAARALLRKLLNPGDALRRAI